MVYCTVLYSAVSSISTSWGYSMMKIHAFGLIDYNRILFVDSDIIFVRDIDRIFYDSPLTSKLSAIPDQSSGCNGRRAVNGGLLVIQPSSYMHASALQCLDDRGCSCISGSWQWSDQEMIQCWCGYTDQNNKPATRPDIACSVLPVYNSAWPLTVFCPDVAAGDDLPRYPYQDIHSEYADMSMSIQANNNNKNDNKNIVIASPTHGRDRGGRHSHSRSDVVIPRALHFMAHSKPWSSEMLNGDIVNSTGRATDRYSAFWWCIHDAALPTSSNFTWTYETVNNQKAVDALLACTIES
jgi:hypothetical protein